MLIIIFERYLSNSTHNIVRGLCVVWADEFSTFSLTFRAYRLSMSASSSQTSSLREHVNALRTNKLSATPTAVYRGSNYDGEDFLRRQETVLEKQTVRITPPSYADGPKSTYIIEKRRIHGIGNVDVR